MIGPAVLNALKDALNNGSVSYSLRQRQTDHAPDAEIKNIEKKDEVIDTITLFGFTAEEMLEAGAAYEDVMAFGGLVG